MKNRNPELSKSQACATVSAAAHRCSTCCVSVSAAGMDDADDDDVEEEEEEEEPQPARSISNGRALANHFALSATRLSQ
ncbi:MAG: hypothetical protein JWM76_2937 [Pseudonocardiales bacterium]|nr:hypothetical protein [Pseudonocardiales bacterium]